MSHNQELEFHKDQLSVPLLVVLSVVQFARTRIDDQSHRTHPLHDHFGRRNILRPQDTPCQVTAWPWSLDTAQPARFGTDAVKYAAEVTGARRIKSRHTDSHPSLPRLVWFHDFGGCSSPSAAQHGYPCDTKHQRAKNVVVTRPHARHVSHQFCTKRAARKPEEKSKTRECWKHQLDQWCSQLSVHRQNIPPGCSMIIHPISLCVTSRGRMTRAALLSRRGQ